MNKPLLFFLTFLLHFSVNVIAQIPTTWVIDSTQNVLSYESDAIYFKRPGGILKADYQGNEIWARQIPFPIRHFSVDQNSIVCLDDSGVYRLDTSGNILWARSLVPFICPGIAISNRLGAVTINGNYIYVSTNQYNLSNYQSYNSMVVFDTLGNVINSWCDSFLISYHDQPVGSIKSLQSGAWILRTFSTGLQSGCGIVKVDNFGNVTNLLGAGQGTYQTYGKIIPLVDSNYFTFNNYYTEFFGQETICKKFDEQGNILWVVNIRSTGQIQWLGFMTNFWSATSDDSSNIYLTGSSVDDNDSSRNVIIKLSPSGNLVYCKAWVNQSLADINYHNGFIYSDGGSKIFDTSFFSPCYAPDTTIGIILIGPSMQSGGFIPSYPTINYLPANIPTPVANLLPPSLRYDLCTQNGMTDEKFNPSVSIYPNPTNDELHIDLMRGSNNEYHIEVFNQIGEEIYSLDFSVNSVTLNCYSFRQGIYFIKIQCSEWSTIEKLIVK